MGGGGEGVRVPFQVERSGFREPGSRFLYFFALFFSPPPPFFASLALSKFLPRSLLVRQETGREGEGGRGRRALIRADGVSFHEYWPSTVSLAPYRFARDIARVLCRSLVRSSARSFIRSVRSRSPRRCSLARSRVCEIRGVTAGSEIEARRYRAVRSASPSLPFRSFLAADVTRTDYRGSLYRGLWLVHTERIYLLLFPTG